MPNFLEHFQAAVAIPGICLEVDLWIMLGVGIYCGGVGSVDWWLGSEVVRFGVGRRIVR